MKDGLCGIGWTDMKRTLLLTVFLFPVFLVAQPSVCDPAQDSVLNLWYRNYKMNFVRGEKWKAASLGMQILRYCPAWKPELYRETGLLYQDILDTTRTVSMRVQLKDTLISLYTRAALQTGDSAGWYLVRAAAALKYEDQSDSILAQMLEPAIRLNPLRCPVSILEDYFRIMDWKTRRGTLDTNNLEIIYQQLNVMLARQYVFRDSLREKEQITKAKTQMAWRMARYLPDTATLIREARALKSDRYEDWVRVYARLFARNVEQESLMAGVRKELARTGQETIWEARRLLALSSSPGADAWIRLADQETDKWMKAWYLLKAASERNQAQATGEAWKILCRAYSLAPDYGGVEVVMGKSLRDWSRNCEANRMEWFTQACAYFQSAARRDIRYRNLDRTELAGFAREGCKPLPSGTVLRLTCAPQLEITLP